MFFTSKILLLAVFTSKILLFTYSHFKILLFIHFHFKNSHIFTSKHNFCTLHFKNSHNLTFLHFFPKINTQNSARTHQLNNIVNQYEIQVHTGTEQNNLRVGFELSGSFVQHQVDDGQRSE
jgi:hypothetical protein